MAATALCGAGCATRTSNLRPCSPALPGQSGYNKRLRKLAPTIAWLIGVLVADTSVGDDDLWVVDSTPVEARSLDRDGQTLGSGRVGPVRLLRLALPLLLGSAAASAVHRATDRPWGGR